MPAAKSTTRADWQTRHILISQCLQNDFFLNGDCRLVLQDQQVRQLLLRKSDYEKVVLPNGRRQIDDKYLKEGPLGRFLEATVGAALAGKTRETLHVVNIRDWHEHDESYDNERRVVGRHCEKGTWGAGYIDGFEKYLDPRDPYTEDKRARFCRRRNARIYHVHADSLFDFRPRWNERSVGTQPRFKVGRSELQALLDVLIAGTKAQVDALAAELDGALANAYADILNKAADEVDETSASDGRPARVYVAVIGVYTDVKVQVLLTSLRNRYELANLAVSDTLTRSQTLERHLSGLDFADKVLNVEIIHGISDLACFLGCEPPAVNESDIVGSEDFSRFRTYFMNKQIVLGYENEKVREYSDLAGPRSVRLYEAIRKANMFLIWSGAGFLALSLVGTILHFIDPERWSWQYPVATGGLGVAELVAVFFAPAIRRLQRNLTNLVSLKMIVERHSLKSSVTRYHLTTPEVLGELHDEEEERRSSAQVEALAKQLLAIDQSHRSDYEALTQIVAFAEEDGGKRTAAVQTDGSAAQDTAKVPAETAEPSAAGASPKGGGAPRPGDDLADFKELAGKVAEFLKRPRG